MQKFPDGREFLPPARLRLLMQLRRLQKPGPVGGEDANGQRFVVAHDLQHDLAAGRAAGPDLAPEPGEARDRIVAHREDAVAGPQPGLARRPSLGETGDDDRVLDLGGIEAEPGRGGRFGRP